MLVYRPYTPDDYPFLREMLFEAVFWSRTDENRPSLEEGLSYDYTKHILEAFGDRKGDIAVIAEFEGKNVGAAFMRYWKAETDIRGFISTDIPVLVIGVASEHRRQGIATGLMNALKQAATDQGIHEISLCVTKSNIAYQLYVNCDFKIVEDIDSSYNMLWKG